MNTCTCHDAMYISVFGASCAECEELELRERDRRIAAKRFADVDSRERDAIVGMFVEHRRAVRSADVMVHAAR